MTHYELMLIIDPTLGEDDKNTTLETVRTLITTHKWKIEKEDIWGEKKFAYKIKGSQTGFYALFYIEIDGTSLQDITKTMNLDTHIWRFMFVNLED